MWLITTQGFYSVVEHRDDPGQLLVRARRHEDLEALKRNYLPELDIWLDGRADYPYRALVDRERFARACEAMVLDGIDYPNFKDAVANRQGPERAWIYGDVWAELTELERLPGETPRTPPSHHPV